MLWCYNSASLHGLTFFVSCVKPARLYVSEIFVFVSHSSAMTVIGEQSSRDTLLSDMVFIFFHFAFTLTWLLCFRLICAAPWRQKLPQVSLFCVEWIQYIRAVRQAISCNNMQAVVIVIERDMSKESNREITAFSNWEMAGLSALNIYEGQQELYESEHKNHFNATLVMSEGWFLLN